MVNPNSFDFAAHPTTVAEVEGEIVPTYEKSSNGNHPKYPPESLRDREMPHDFSFASGGETAIEGTKPEIPVDVRAIIDEHREKYPGSLPSNADGITGKYIQGRKDILG